MSVAARELWVCFSPPAELPDGALLLSFLRADEEEDAESRWPGRVVRGREEVEGVRDRARRAYVDVVARFGAAPSRGGRTLRESLGGRRASLWWYHPTSMRDGMSRENTVYLDLLRLFAIDRVTRRLGAPRRRLVGAPPSIRDALEGRRSRVSMVALGRALGARAWVIAHALLVRALARRRAPARAAVALQAHWDWSVRVGDDGSVTSPVFGDVPERLRAAGRALAWFTWLDPRERSRTLVAEARDLAHASREVVALQGLLTAREIVASGLDLRPLIAIVRALRRRAVRDLLREDGLDLLPLLHGELIAGAAGPSIPRARLVEVATERAARDVAPAVLLACTEYYIHNRAMYAGARAGAPGVRCWAAQHATYSPDKTWALIHPEIELQGAPDGRAMPVPDELLAIGHADERLFLANGFAPDRVRVPGGLRYTHVAASEGEPSIERPLRVLLVASLDSQDEDLDMVGAAVRAADRVDGLQLVLVNHPQERLPISAMPGFSGFAAALEVSRDGFAAELERCAAVLTATSTAGAETVLRGLPTWQWVCAAPDLTAFLDVPGAAPRFTSVAALRDALQRLASNPAEFVPPAEVRERVLAERFGDDPGRACESVAAQVLAATAQRFGTPPVPGGQKAGIPGRYET